MLTKMEITILEGEITNSLVNSIEIKLSLMNNTMIVVLSMIGIMTIIIMNQEIILKIEITTILEQIRMFIEIMYRKWILIDHRKRKDVTLTEIIDRIWNMTDLWKRKEADMKIGVEMTNANINKMILYIENIQMSLNNKTITMIMLKFVSDTTTEFQDRKMILTEKIREIIDRKCISTDQEMKEDVIEEGEAEEEKTSLTILYRKLIQIIELNRKKK